jgi:hypothetical protein
MQSSCEEDGWFITALCMRICAEGKDGIAAGDKPLADRSLVEPL